VRYRQFFAGLKQNRRNLRNLPGTISARLDRIPTISKPSARLNRHRVALGSLQVLFDSFTVSAHLTISSTSQASAFGAELAAGRHGQRCTSCSSGRTARPTRQAGTTPAAGRGRPRSPQRHDTKRTPAGQQAARHGLGGGGGRTPSPQGSPGPPRRGREGNGLGCWCGGHEKNEGHQGPSGGL